MRHPVSGDWVQADYGFDLFLTKRLETYFAFCFNGYELADSNSVANSTAVWRLAPAGQFGKQAVEGLVRRGVVECLPGPIVEAGGDQVEVALVQPGQGAAFRQVLAQQAVGVLVGAPLPG